MFINWCILNVLLWHSFTRVLYWFLLFFAKEIANPDLKTELAKVPTDQVGPGFDSWLQISTIKYIYFGVHCVLLWHLFTGFCAGFWLFSEVSG